MEFPLPITHCVSLIWGKHICLFNCILFLEIFLKMYLSSHSSFFFLLLMRFLFEYIEKASEPVFCSLIKVRVTCALESRKWFACTSGNRQEGKDGGLLKVFYIFDTFKMVKSWKIVFKDFFFFAKCKMYLRGCLKNV